MMQTIKFSLGVFQQVNQDTFLLSNKHGQTVYYGKNPIEAMAAAQGMYETAIRELFLPAITAEGYNRIGVKANDPRGIQ